MGFWVAITRKGGHRATFTIDGDLTFFMASSSAPGFLRCPVDLSANQDHGKYRPLHQLNLFGILSPDPGARMSAGSTSGVN